MASLAGSATIYITPPVGIELVAYHRPEPAQGVLDHLVATAIYLQHDGKRCLLISVEHIGLLVRHVDHIRAAIAADLNLTPTQIMICFTHTHSGPDADADTPIEAAYRQTLIGKLREVAQQAMNNSQPCTVGWNVTHAQIGVNRREHLPGGTARHGVNPDGPVDDRIGILSIHQQATGERLAVVVICTAHANVLKSDNLLISGDYPGWTRSQLTATLNCPVAILLGSSGDCNALWRGSVEALEKMARTISDAVLANLPQPEPLTTLHIESENIMLSLQDIPEPDQIAQMAQDAAHNWEVDTQQWRDHMTTLYQQGKRTLNCEAELQLLQINEGVIVGLPMEPFADYALNLARQVQNERFFFNGYTNGYIGYLPTAAEIPFGGYEINWMPIIYGLLTDYLMPIQPDVEQQIIDAVLRLARNS